uniref:Aa_trans domain-containing protein n=1 Tax=Macrostomum lignano TaxID=282301 RepID=A0A1I8FIX7_9PLAT
RCPGQRRFAAAAPRPGQNLPHRASPAIRRHNRLVRPHTLLLAVLIPNIGDVISLLGSLAAVFIFIFPGLCLFKIGLDDASWLKQLAAAVFLVLGSFIFGVTTVQSISNLI